MKCSQLVVAAFVAFAVSGPTWAQKAKSAKNTEKAADGKKKSEAKKAEKRPFKTLNENISYVVGMNFGRRLISTLQQEGIEVEPKKLAGAIKVGKKTIVDMRRQGIEVVDKPFQQGFHAGLGNGKSLMADSQIRGVIQEYQKYMLATAGERRKKEAERRKKEAEELKALANRNKMQGQLFLAKNKKKKGVITTKSGLQYEIIRAGKGKSPKADDTVATHYRGTLLSGVEFDSSIKSGEPVSFSVNGVIRGWTEALQLMKVGAKWKLYIPSDLAYGPNGSRSGSIGPNSTLVFEIELLSIKERKKSPAPPKEK